MKNSFSIKIISAVVISAVMLTSFSVFAGAVSSASSPFPTSGKTIGFMTTLSGRMREDT